MMVRMVINLTCLSVCLTVCQSVCLSVCLRGFIVNLPGARPLMIPLVCQSVCLSEIAIRLETVSHHCSEFACSKLSVMAGWH